LETSRRNPMYCRAAPKHKNMAGMAG